VNGAFPYITMPNRFVNETSGATWLEYFAPSPAFHAAVCAATIARIAPSDATSCARTGVDGTPAQTMIPTTKERSIGLLLPKRSPRAL
jgi:hypothetical protein